MTSDIKQAALSHADHDRDAIGLRHVYAVLSRRAGGVSIGINLNPNRACNWHCVYCQVPGLVRGGPPPVDLDLLADELERVLAAYLPPAGQHPLRDLAIAGDGEPTAAHGFERIVERLLEVRARMACDDLPLRLITNGSQLYRDEVKQGIRRIGEAGGEIWFKVDAGRSEDYARINGVTLAPETVLRRLRRCCELAPTWVQTCLFRFDGELPSAVAWQAYVELLCAVQRPGLQGVLLYGIARPSMQAEAPRLAALLPEEFEPFERMLKQQGLTVRVSP